MFWQRLKSNKISINADKTKYMLFSYLPYRFLSPFTHHCPILLCYPPRLNPFTPPHTSPRTHTAVPLALLHSLIPILRIQSILPWHCPLLCQFNPHPSTAILPPHPHVCLYVRKDTRGATICTSSVGCWKLLFCCQEKERGIYREALKQSTCQERNWSIHWLQIGSTRHR